MRRLPFLLAIAVLAGCDPKPAPQGDTSGVKDGRIIFKDVSGRVVTLADLKGADGAVHWEVVGGKSIPPRAQQLHENARRLGSNGELEKAVDLLKQAADLAPEWPYPPYDLAYTYLLLGKDADALEMYQKADRLEPRGFFTAKTAIWALRKEQEGNFPKGTYRRYLEIEWARNDTEKARLAQAIVEEVPNYPPALKELALRAHDGRQRELMEIALAARPDPETYGMLMVNKAIDLNNDGNKAEAINILGGLMLSTNSTLGTVAVARAVLAHIAGSETK